MISCQTWWSQWGFVSPVRLKKEPIFIMETLTRPNLGNQESIIGS